MKLNAKNVSEIFFDCFPANKDVDISGLIIVEGILAKFGFLPEKIEKHRNDIVEMLMELPKEFMGEEGGGWSFLNASVNKDGVQWTGDHRIMEQLFCLGIAIDKVKNVFPREVWGGLPGGVPYYVVLV